MKFVVITLSLSLSYVVLTGKGLSLNTATEQEHVGFINLYGEIGHDAGIDSDKIIPSIQKAFNAPGAVAVVLNINSPGGSPVHSGRIFDEIRFQRKQHPAKKVYAVIGDVGASGGYFIAAAGDEIYADKSSLIGSIGVISASFGFTELMEDIGIERRVITAGANKSMLDPFTPVSKEQTEGWQEVLEGTHDYFISAVKKGRGERLKVDDEIFSGLVWNGQQAKELGLIDGYASLHTLGRDVIGNEKFINYSPSKHLLDELSGKVKVLSSDLLNKIYTPSFR